MSKSVCLFPATGLPTSGDGHTLRCRDLGMILAEPGNDVSDGEHSAIVTKQEWDQAKVFAPRSAII